MKLAIGSSLNSLQPYHRSYIH